MTLRPWTVPLLLASLALFTACTQPLPAPSATAGVSATLGPTAQRSPLPFTTPHVSTPQSTPASVLTPTRNATPDSTQTAAIQQARIDLARRLQAPLAEVAVVRVDADMFPVQSLGCPDAEATPQVGLPAEAPGLQISLSVAGKRYIYRARLEQLVYCGEE